MENSHEITKGGYFFSRPDKVGSRLHVCTMISNPMRFRVRWKHFEDFLKRVVEAGAIPHVVEVSFGERAATLDKLVQASGGNFLHVQTNHELWHKERALNLLAQRLPLDWRYVAFLDSDITFMNDDWADEIVHQLQHYAVLQPWSHAIDLDAEGVPIKQYISFAYAYQNGLLKNTYAVDYDGYYYGTNGAYGHPGFGLCFRREAFDAVGGLIDHAILGSGDWYMVNALVGMAKKRTLKNPVSAGFERRILVWQDLALKYIRKNFGYMTGTIAHAFHGSKSRRRYLDRNKILKDCKFDPDYDLIPDWQGMWQLNPERIELRDRIRAYFRQRNEDSLYNPETEKRHEALWQHALKQK